MLYYAPMMFTCLKVLKSSSCEGRVVHVKYELLGQTTSYWVGQDKQAGCKTSVSKGGAQSDRRTRPGRIHEVLQGVASMYKCIQ